MVDALVIGAGPNGLVAANLLADRGWEVTVLEAAPEPGGAVKSAELVEPGFVNDVCSSFYPLAAASPHMRGLELERYGLRWRRSPGVVAHPLRDGRCPLLSLDVDETAASLDGFAPGDGNAWRGLYDLWLRVGPHALAALLSPFPPVRPALRLVRELGRGELARFARFALLPVRRLGEETFRGEGGPLLLAGNALHSDLGPETPPSGVYGWVLCCLGQQLGFPAAEGGAGRIAAALVRRLELRGGRVLYGRRAARIEVSGGSARAVLTGSERFPASRAVLADVSAPALYLELVGREHLPARLLDEIARFQWDNGTVKVDWTLDAPIPWTAAPARRAGTLHVAEGLDGLTRQSCEIALGLLPAEPYLVMGQYAHFDPTRAPAGRDTAWAYTHVPQRIAGDARGELTGSWDERETRAFADRIEEQVEARAPGFRSLIRGRRVTTPRDFEEADPNLVNGALNGGTAQLHQQLVLRPVAGLARADTPIRGLFLASASAHPGGGVHGAPGANAAAAALAADSPRPGARLARAVQR
ncbi:MAG: NAD(P)/FAD-dependent oxidoreductase [Thermoleophilaceae bacterium]|nr:NAD(P)/FAD-dependent oxidoreductase [Thermoleophilaceae bacterium]